MNSKLPQYKANQPIIGLIDDSSLFSVIEQESSSIKVDEILKEFNFPLKKNTKDYINNIKINKLDNDLNQAVVFPTNKEKLFFQKSIKHDTTKGIPTKAASEKLFLKLKDEIDYKDNNEHQDINNIKDNILKLLSDDQDNHDKIEANSPIMNKSPVDERKRIIKNNDPYFIKKNTNNGDREEKHENIQSAFKLGANNILKRTGLNLNFK